MRSLERVISAAGFQTRAIDYPSHLHGIAALSEHVAERLDDLRQEPLIAVTHSLGGLILRQLTGRFDWRGAVMLAPPNRGSAAATRLGRYGWFRAIWGPAASEVASGGPWPLPPMPLRIVAGTRRVSAANPTSLLLPAFGVFGPGEAHDGTVAVAETEYAGAELVTVDATHTWIMNHPVAQASVLEFVRKVGAG